MKIKLTADTRVLLSAGTLVDVSKETAEVIRRLGRCEIVDEAKAEEKAEEPEADSSEAWGKVKETKDAPKPKKRASKAKKEE